MLGGEEARRDEAARSKLGEAALASSIAERKAMEVERAVVDLYRTFVMKEHIGERFDGTVTAVVGSGLFVQLDAPFVDVMVRLEDLGHDHWEIDDEGLRVVAARSGDRIALGDRIAVEIVDAAILRRTVYARRAGAQAAAAGQPRGAGRGRDQGRGHDQKKRPGQRPGAADHRRQQGGRGKAGPPGKKTGGGKKGKKGRRR